MAYIGCVLLGILIGHVITASVDDHLDAEYARAVLEKLNVIETAYRNLKQ